MKRRDFIVLSSLSAISISSTVQAFKMDGQNDERTKNSILNSMKSKKEITSIQYKVERWLDFVTVTSDSGHDDSDDQLHAITHQEIYFHDNKIKVVFYFPSKKVPEGIGTKITLLITDGDEIQKYESLTNEFETRIIRKKCKYPFNKYFYEKVKDLYTMPFATIPMRNLKPKRARGEDAVEFFQNNRRYLFSISKGAVLEEEVFDSSNTRNRLIEFKDFTLVDGLYFPTLVIDQQFRNNTLDRRINRRITEIKINSTSIDEFIV